MPSFRVVCMYFVSPCASLHCLCEVFLKARAAAVTAKAMSWRVLSAIYRISPTAFPWIARCLRILLHFRKAGPLGHRLGMVCFFVVTFL